MRRDALWYPFRLGRAAGAVDVLHCTTFRAPLRPRAPLVVTVHDLALLRHPEAFPRWHRATGVRALRAGVAAADAIVCVSAFTRDELVELLDVPAERTRIVPNASTRVGRTGLSPTATTSSRSARSSRGRTSPRRSKRRDRRGGAPRGRRARLGRRRRRGWVGEPSDTELAALCAARGAWSIRRCTRASGCLSWRRWRAAHPSSRAAAARRRRSPRVPRCSSTPGPGRDRGGNRRGGPTARRARRGGLAGARPSPGTAPPISSRRSGGSSREPRRRRRRRPRPQADRRREATCATSSGRSRAPPRRPGSGSRR